MARMMRKTSAALTCDYGCCESLRKQPTRASEKRNALRDPDFNPWDDFAMAGVRE